jgi:hypothetical protein
MLDLDCPAHLQPHTLAAAAMRLTAPHAQWHALFGNSEPPFYDKWALRSSALGMDYDCLLDRKQIARRGNCFTYSIAIDPTGPILPVDSAFSGVALYSLPALRHSGCRYGSPHQAGCEHVPFHTCLRGKGLRLGIDPSLLTRCGDDHVGSRRKYVRRHVYVSSNGTVVTRGAV